MALQPVVEPWPPIISASKLFNYAWSASSYDTREVWQYNPCLFALFVIDSIHPSEACWVL